MVQQLSICYIVLMNLRFGTLHNGEIYHVFNRGVDKRKIFINKKDIIKFQQLLQYCNREEPIRSIRNLFKGDLNSKFDTSCPLVVIHAYALVGNHYHLLLEQVVDDGISEFMKRLSGGYTRSFNHHHTRTGSLFGGRYKYIHCKNDRHVMRMCAYINLNYLIHGFTDSGPTTVSSQACYVNQKEDAVCDKEFCLSLFNSVDHYQEFAYTYVQDIVERRKDENMTGEFFE